MTYHRVMFKLDCYHNGNKFATRVVFPFKINCNIMFEPLPVKNKWPSS